MNKRQKLVQQQFLNNEEAVIKRLTTVYNNSLDDITKKSKKLYDEIEELTSIYDDVEDEAEKAVLKSRIQSKVYQKQYQDSLKKQVSDILDKMHDEEFKTVSDYVKTCYEDGFVGTLYDIQGQGIPLAFPLDQEAMVRAVQLDSKISKGLYTHLGEDVAMLKKHITAQVSRGIASNMTFAQIAQQLSTKMVGQYKNKGGSLYNAMRIARTEGHRIQCQAGMDACYNAKDRGADVVKQWDSTLDGKTRTSHINIDGQIKELDEKFDNGLMFPGDPSGAAAEVIHCRCALLQRARWATKGGFTKMNNFTKQLETFDNPEDYAEFKKGFFSKENNKYMDYVQSMEGKYKTKDWNKILDAMTDREAEHYMKLLENNPMFNKKALTKSSKSDKIQAKKFVPVKDMKEAKTRFSNSLGVPEDKINLGRMKPELANQYLEGVERFMDDFPMLKGYYGTLGTKTGSPNTLGLNRLVGKYESHNGAQYIRYSSELHFKNPKDLAKMMETYEWVSSSGEGYVNSTPLSTAIHELVHGIDKAITLKQHGGYDKNGLGIVFGSNHGQAIAGVSRGIIQQVRQEMFGKQYGKDVADATRYLGRYARTSPSEELAEAISYEYVNPSNPYSARILELFKEKVKGAF